VLKERRRVVSTRRRRPSARISFGASQDVDDPRTVIVVVERPEHAGSIVTMR